MDGFVYVLHFATPLHHATHYVGSTLDLPARLAAHRAGQGARLTEVLAEVGIDWTVGGLYRVPAQDVRKAEKVAKRAHNGRRFCMICGATATIPGSQPIDPEVFPWLSTATESTRRTETA